MKTSVIIALFILARSSPSKSTISLFKAPQRLQDINEGTRPLIKSSGQGGLNGTTFDDVFTGGVKVVGLHSINISCGDQLDAFQVIYFLSNGSLYQGPKHGKSSHPPFTIILGANEYVSEIQGQTDGVYIFQLTITTVGPEYERKVYGPFGTTSRISFSFKGHIIGFHGRSGDRLDNVGVYSFEKAMSMVELGVTHSMTSNKSAHRRNKQILHMAWR